MHPCWHETRHAWQPWKGNANVGRWDRRSGGEETLLDLPRTKQQESRAHSGHVKRQESLPGIPYVVSLCPLTIPISLAVDNSNFPAPSPLKRRPDPGVVTDPSVLHVHWFIKLCRQPAFVPSTEAVSLKRSCHSSFTSSSSSRWCSSLWVAREPCKKPCYAQP